MRYSSTSQDPLKYETFQTNSRLPLSTPDHKPGCSVSHDEAVEGCILRFLPEAYLQFCNNKPVLFCKELITIEQPVDWKNPPRNTNKNKTDLLLHHQHCYTMASGDNMGVILICVSELQYLDIKTHVGIVIVMLRQRKYCIRKKIYQYNSDFNFDSYDFDQSARRWTALFSQWVAEKLLHVHVKRGWLVTFFFFFSPNRVIIMFRY